MSVATGPATIKKTHEGEHHGDFGNVAVATSSATYLWAMCAAVNSCNLGYDLGVSTEAARLIQQDFDLSRVQRELFIGSINFWAMFGAIGAQYYSDRYGRRRTFIVAAIGFLLGILLMVVAQGYFLLMVGRLFVGLGVGVGLAIDPLYISEISTAKHRGWLVTYAEIALNVGIVFGFATGLFLGGLSDGIEWRVMFSLGAIMPIVMIYLVKTIMPETPRWLVAKERLEEARDVLRQIYPEGYDIEPVLEDIVESIRRDEIAENAVGWVVIMHPTPALRRMLLVGIGTAVAQQAVGIDAIQYYLLDVIEQSGIESRSGQSIVLILLGILKLVFIVVGGRLFDRRGRRPLFFISLAGMAGALLLVSLGFFISSSLSTGATVIGLGLYLSFFSVGMGPGAWLVPSEVFALIIRAKAMSVATCLNRATGTLMASTFLSTANAIGWGGFFLMLCIISLIVLAFLYMYLPETKGRSIEDMSLFFAEITGDNSVLEAETQIGGQHQPTTEMVSPQTGSTTEEGGEVI